MFFIVFVIFVLVIILSVIASTLYVVRQQSVAIIERFGKYQYCWLRDSCPYAFWH